MYPAKKENALLILHELQRKSNHSYLSKRNLSLASSYLDLSLGSIYGLATYYEMFSLVPRGKYIIKLCISPVCQMLGSGAVLNHLFDLFKIREGATTSDGLFTVETTECLGQCDKSPCMLINEKLHGNLTKKKIKKIIMSYKTIG